MKQTKLKSIFSMFGILFLGYMMISFSGNPPNGHTGAPPSNSTCGDNNGGCHAVGNYSGTMSISGLPAMIMANTTYTITVTVTATGNSPVRGGFQMTALDGSNAAIGSWSNPGSGVGIMGQFAEHSGAKSYSGGMVSWTVDWTAPASGTATVTMYACTVMGNGSGSLGDHVLTTTATGSLMAAPTLNVSITNSTNASCFGVCDGSATASASGGSGQPYTYNWSNGQSGATANDLCAGSYTVTATDSGGATATAQVTISEPSELDVVITNFTNITCSNPTGTATASASGGTPGYNYNWSHGQNGPTATFVDPGTYSVTVSDLNQCTDVTQVTILEDTQDPIAVAGPAGVIDCNNSTVILDGTGSSTGSNFSYAWTGPGIISGGNTLMPEVNVVGTYTLTVTNSSNGCTASDQVAVTENTNNPVASAGDDMNIDCINSQVTLDGTQSSQGGNFTYQWTTQNGNIVSGANTLTPVVDAAGLYALLVTDTSNGCVAEDFVSVNINIVIPSSSASVNGQINCTTSIVTVDGTGSSTSPNFTYQWTGPCILSGGNTLMADVNCSGTYCLTVTDNTNGCTSEACVTVTENITPPIADAGSGMNINSNNPTVVLDGSGSSQGSNFSYQWTGPDIQSGGTTLTPTVGEPGDYSIIVVDNNNGCSSESTTTVTETEPPSATVTVNNNVLCNGDSTGSATISVTLGNPPYTYEWSTGNTTDTDNMLPAGTHSFTVTDSDGSTTTGMVTITEPDLLVPNTSATGETSAGANDGTATANPTGGMPGFTYSWSNGETTQTITDLMPDDYTVTVTDAEGCTATESVTVNSFDCSNVSVSIDEMDVSCNGGNDGSATANLMNGTAPVSYVWSNGGDTQTISGLEVGIYSVTVTDGNNCVVIGNVTIQEPTALSISSVQQINVACNGESTGEATVEVTGGTPTYTYLWDDPNSQTTQTATNLSAGTYTPTITDANGCTITTEIIITEPPILEANVTSTNETFAGANNGTASSNPIGGTPGYTFEWNNGETTAMIENLPAGEYCVTVTDQNGCTDQACVTVEAIDCSGISTSVTSQDANCFGAADGMATIETTGGDEPYTYLWSDGGTGASRSDLAAGTYQVTCEDAKGCTNTISVVIGQPDEIIIMMSSTIESQPGAGDGTASAQPNGGAGGFTFNWNNGETTPTIEGLVGGFYCVTVTDATGCTEEDCVEVEIGNCGAFLNIGTTSVTCSGDADGSAFVVASGGQQPFTFEWSNGMQGDSIAGLAAGIYEVTATDPNGCQLVGSTEVNEPLPVVALLLNQVDPACEGDSTGVLNGGAEGGFLPYNFVWSTGSTEPTISNLPAGMYSLIVSDLNDCTDTLTAEVVAAPDTVAPVIIIQSASLYLDEDGMVSLTADMLDMGTFDNCELSSISIDSESFSCDEVGTNTVVFSALDAAGNLSTIDVFVNVWDTIPPVLICPDDIVTTECGTPIDYDLPIGTDICGDVTSFLANGLPPGGVFPVGTSTVVYTGLDQSNNATSCSFTVTVDSDLGAEIGDSFAPSCNGFEDGFVTVIPSGGDGPYFIQWSNGANTDTLSNLPSGTYTVSVVDNNGCEVQNSVTLDEPDPIIINVDNVNPENGNNMDGSIEVSVSGGAMGGYSYDWFFDGMVISNDEDIFNLESGNYIIVATDASNCATSDTVFVDFMSNTLLPEIVEELSIQPNPNNGKFNLNIELGETKNTQIDIFDFTGRQIQFGQKESVLNKSYDFDLSTFAEGVYLIRIVIDDWVVSRKILVSRG